MSKVSVIVPIYNAEKKLHKCLNSILKQTYKDFELILVNDGSTDRSFQICKDYEKKDSRVIVINQSNQGCIAARRRGLNIAKSNYVMFVDADDWIDKRTIELLHIESTKSNTDIVVCNSYKVFGDKAIIKTKNESKYFSEDKFYCEGEIKKDLVTAYLHGHPFPANLVAKLYKRELLLNCGNYLDCITFFGEDLYYNLEMFLKAKKVKVINLPLYYYRAGGNTSRFMSYLFDDMVNGYEIQKQVINQHFIDTKQTRFNGISIMLLNTFKTCLFNLFNSTNSEAEIKKLINEYVSNQSVRECLNNEGSKEYFSPDYLQAISEKNVEFLYEFGLKMYNKKKPKMLLTKVLSRLSIL